MKTVPVSDDDEKEPVRPFFQSILLREVIVQEGESIDKKKMD